MRKDKREKIAIVGASVAGCAAAIMLKRANYNVTIFEQRNQAAMLDRGAGIVLPEDVVSQLIELDIFDPDFPAIELNQRMMITHDTKRDSEQLLTAHPFYGLAMHWSSIYQNLCKRLSSDQIYYNSKVSTVTKPKNVRLSFNHHDEHEFDVVLFADGYYSLGRRFLFPAARPEFTKYIAWRGVLNRSDKEAAAHVADKALYYLYDKGHLLMYAIPDLTSPDPLNNLTINWLLYETLDNNHPLVKEYRAQDNIAPEGMTKHYVDYLHDLANKNLPPFARNVVVNTEKPFTQAICDAMVPEYFVENIGLLGDAAILLRPHVAGGATKALLDAMSLSLYLDREESIFLALQRWSKNQIQNTTNLYHLGRSLGDLLVAKTPNWKKLDKPGMDTLWQQAVTGQNWHMEKQQQH